MVVLEQPTEPLSDSDGPIFLILRPAEQLIPDPLMAALTLVVSYIPGNGPSGSVLPQEDHLLQTLPLDRPRKPLRIRVHVRCLIGGEQNLDARIPENGLESGGENRIAIDDEKAPSVQEALVAVGEIPGVARSTKRRWRSAASRE
jgi:hypothetical protein